MRRLVPLIIVAVLGLGGCGVSDAFTCTTDDQCVLGGVEGRCEAAGACSFLDASCESGRRYAELSPGGIGGECVIPPDGSVEVDAPLVSDAPPGDARLSDAGPGLDGGITVDLAVIADTELDGTMTTLNYGAAPDLVADGSRVILLRFDVTGIGPGTVVFVELHFWTTLTGSLDRGSLQIFRVLQDWTEGTQVAQTGVANWTQRLPDVNWAGAGASGASRDPTVFGSGTPNQDNKEQIIVLSPSLVQGWLGAPATNDGIVLATVNQVTRRLDIVSREGTAGRAPFLRVVLVPGPASH